MNLYLILIESILMGIGLAVQISGYALKYGVFFCQEKGKFSDFSKFPMEIKMTKIEHKKKIKRKKR